MKIHKHTVLLHYAVGYSSQSKELADPDSSNFSMQSSWDGWLWGVCAPRVTQTGDPHGDIVRGHWGGTEAPDGVMVVAPCGDRDGLSWTGTVAGDGGTGLSPW